MNTFELVVTLLVAVVALVWLAERIGVPYPMLLVVGGLILAASPVSPHIELSPEIVLVVFLPPILFQAAQTTSLRDFKTYFRPISRLAVGLVVVTTVSIAVVAHWIVPGIGWPAAFVLGAVLSPPDAVAATAIFQRLGAPSRIVTILEGESLINDASALVVYTFAVAAVTTGAFSLGDALISFPIVVGIGIAAGFVAGRVLGKLALLVAEPSLAMVLLLLSPSAIYVLAEHLGGSGVLAVVTMGLVHGYTSPRLLSPTLRVRSFAMWDLITIVINGLVFLLIGLEIEILLDTLSRHSVESLAVQAGVIFLTMVAVRFVYVFTGRPSSRQMARSDLAPLDTRSRFVIAWSGLRGVVSLATALALPLLTDAGDAFDHREEIILITTMVVVASLFGLGLPLPWLLRRLNFAEDGSHEMERKLAIETVSLAMLEQYEAAVERSPELEPVIGPVITQMRSRLQLRDEAELDRAEVIAEQIAPRMMLQQQAINAGREALLDLRDAGRIGDEVRRDVERFLDLQELQNVG